MYQGSTWINYVWEAKYKTGIPIFFEANIDGKTVNLKVKQEDVELADVIGEVPNDVIGTYLRLGYDLFNGVIDLNNFKIYVEDELVYQPCLKIPYNVSKTGLKVANADARERVIGMGEDYGYSQYFTIDEENESKNTPASFDVNDIPNTLLVPPYPICADSVAPEYISSPKNVTFAFS
jgi:hypothetical protein